MGSYAFGFDFGTLSCRGIAIDLETGQVAATAEEKSPSEQAARPELPLP